jgi:hypothetical protein
LIPITDPRIEQRTAAVARIDGGIGLIMSSNGRPSSGWIVRPSELTIPVVGPSNRMIADRRTFWPTRGRRNAQLQTAQPPSIRSYQSVVVRESIKQSAPRPLFERLTVNCSEPRQRDG